MSPDHPHHHEDQPHTAHEPHYWVMAQVCEPDYEKEIKFLQAEIMFVRQKLRDKGQRWSFPGLGFYSHKDWRGYERKLEEYERQLERYSNDTDEGVLPVRFTVYNTSELRDTGVHVKVRVKGGRLDDKRKAPERPERLDGHGKGLPKLALPKAGFTRTGIQIAPHSMKAVLSRLDSRDGAVLVNQIVHLHLGKDTEVTYEIMSRHVPHETGEVELVEKVTA